MLNTLDRQLSYGSMTPAVTQGAGTGTREGWVQVFGSDRSADGTAGDGQTFGLMAGADLDDTRGLFVGVARSSQTLGAGSELDSDNLFAGYYASYALNTVDVDASLTVGVVSNSSDRSVANNMVEGGLETATADYKSYYVMPAATFSGDIAVANGDLTPSVRLSYAAVHDQTYEETGSAANLDVDARTSHLFGARLQIDRGFEGRSLGEGTLMVNLRAGIDAQYAKGGDVSASLMGVDFDLAASDGETTGRGFAGIDLRHIADANGLELFGSFEVGQSNDDVTDLSANIGAVFRF